ncbi:MAG: hypothetical protein MUD08_02815 [Cytophagales bacterium]|jgi:hypothetical protein|nr:hypothetical protein [Cytophagales bacterium]
MRKFTFGQLFFFLVVAVSVSAQSVRTYVVTNEGDTVYASVRFNERLADNNREVFAFVNSRNVRYTPADIKAYYNGLQEYETRNLGDVPVFLQRHTAGQASLYYCDESVLADLIKNYPRLGDQIGYGLKDALKAAFHSSKAIAGFSGRVPVITVEGRSLRVFDPKMPQRKQELADFFYDYPGTESLLSQEQLTPESYEQLIMAYNQWKPQALARLAEKEKNATGF